MFINCTHCKISVEPGIDVSTLKDEQITNETKARCLECGNEVIMSSFMLKTLASSGKKYKAPIAKSAFSFDCTVCHKNLPAMLSKDQAQALCSVCTKPMNLSTMMIQAMKVAKTGSIDPS